MAHQGGELEAPSSTMYALVTAVANGADALELDVHATADGRLVVIHDATVDRTTAGAGAIDTLTLADIQRLDAAHWFIPGEGVVAGRPDSEYPLRGIATGHRAPPQGFTPEDFTIPTLDDVFARFPQTLVNIDIKQTAGRTTAYEQHVADLIAEHGRTDTTMVASFFAEALDTFRGLAPEVATSASPDEVLAFWTAVQEGATVQPLAFQALQVPRTHEDVRVVDAPFVEHAHDAGVAVHVWTIDDESTMHELLDLGVDGVVTNRPTVLEAVLRDRVPGRGD